MPHFLRSTEEIHYAGNHLLIDLFGATKLDDVGYVQAMCEEAAIATGATIIGRHFHHFGDGQGVSGVVLLAESHLSTHTWPERDVATFDVFVCGDCDPRRAIPVLEKAFRPSKVVASLHRRGVMMPG